MAALPSELWETKGCNVLDVETFHLRVLFGSSAITSYRAKDVTITRNSAGNYTVTFCGGLPFWELVHFSWSMQDASGALLFWCITSSTLTTAGALVLECRTEAGTATDPTSGDYGYFEFRLSRNSLNDKFTG